jgi:4-amino-4-deoxy-L-arabinose transferase-like glycosyltransferase
MPELSRSSYSLVLAFIFVVAFGLRVGITAEFVGLDAPPKAEANPDQLDYELFAYRMSIGEGYTLSTGEPTARRTPGTSLALYPVYVLFGRSYALGRIWFCFLSAVTCLATAWTARQCFGSLVAVLSAAWLAFYPGHFYYAMHFLSETPYMLWLILACGFTLRSLIKGSVSSDICAGIFWGAAVLTRGQLLFIVPIAWLALLGIERFRRPAYFRRVLVQTLLLLAVLAPWVARNAAVLGKPTLTLVGGYGFWAGHNDLALHDPRYRGTWVRTSDLVDEEHPLEGGEVEREAAAWKYGLEFVKSHPGEMPGLCLMKLWRFLAPLEDTPNKAIYWSFALGWISAAPFALAGLVLAFRKSGAALVVLLMPILATVAAVIIFYGSPRYRDSLAPVFLILASVALHDLFFFLFPSGEMKQASSGRPYQTHQETA